VGGSKLEHWPRKEIQAAQKAARERKIHKRIDSIEKSQPRLRNRLNNIRTADDAIAEFE
jgi:hypothetical protein